MRCAWWLIAGLVRFTGPAKRLASVQRITGGLVDSGGSTGVADRAAWGTFFGNGRNEFTQLAEPATCSTAGVQTGGSTALKEELRVVVVVRVGGALGSNQRQREVACTLHQCAPVE